MFLRFFCTFWNFSILHGRKGRIVSILHGRKGRIGFSSPKEDKNFPLERLRAKRAPREREIFILLRAGTNLSCPPAHVGQSFLIVYSIGKNQKISVVV